MSVYDYDEEEVGELSDWIQDEPKPYEDEQDEAPQEFDVGDIVASATATATAAVIGDTANVDLDPDHPAARMPATAKRRRTSHTGSSGVVNREEVKRRRPRLHATPEEAREARNVQQRERRLARKAEDFRSRSTSPTTSPSVRSGPSMTSPGVKGGNTGGAGRGKPPLPPQPQSPAGIPGPSPRQRQTRPQPSPAQPSPAQQRRVSSSRSGVAVDAGAAETLPRGGLAPTPAPSPPGVAGGRSGAGDAGSVGQRASGRSGAAANPSATDSQVVFDEDDLPNLTTEQWAERIEKYPNRTVWHPEVKLHFFQRLSAAYVQNQGRMAKDNEKFAGIPEELNQYVFNELPELNYPADYFKLDAIKHMEKKLKSFLSNVVSNFGNFSSGSSFNPQNSRHQEILMQRHPYLPTILRHFDKHPGFFFQPMSSSLGAPRQRTAPAEYAGQAASGGEAVEDDNMPACPQRYGEGSSFRVAPCSQSAAAHAMRTAAATQAEALKGVTSVIERLVASTRVASTGVNDVMQQLVQVTTRREEARAKREEAAAEKEMLEAELLRMKVLRERRELGLDGEVGGGTTPYSSGHGNVGGQFGAAPMGAAAVPGEVGGGTAPYSSGHGNVGSVFGTAPMGMAAEGYFSSLIGAAVAAAAVAQGGDNIAQDVVDGTQIPPTQFWQ